uniref:alpha-1,2-fucosyltransferase n=1 Tax=Algoriphagus sp. TaxID=1872435 RepID=UPI004048D07E
MIIVKLIGGLGNQLFQYAVGRHLAEIHETKLFLDLSEFETYKLHKYALFGLKILENFASENQINFLPIIKEKHFHFDPNFKSIPNNVLLKGYWQTEKYFVEIADIIREEFSLKKSAEGRDKEVLEDILVLNSVSLHIRRGDYVRNTYENQILVSADLEYYKLCVEHITRYVEDCHFFVFSDDPAWVKENLKLSYPVTFVDHNDANTNYEDLRLMSFCKHNIICNSSFSWWGAWLNRNPQKIVCAPKKWFSDETKYIDSKDLIPKSWIKF